jgi:hypothetical protein
MPQVKIVNAGSSPRLLCVDARPRPDRSDKVAWKEYADAQPEAVELRLEVGANLVDDEVWLAMLEHPYVKALVAKGVLREDKTPREAEDFKPGSYVRDLSDLKLPEALKAIDACRDEKQLRTWIDQDPRPNIRKALIARHRVLVPAEARKEDDAVASV